MTDKDVRAVCRLIVAFLATARVGGWIGAALPLEGWLYAIVMTVVVLLVGLVMLGAISEPTMKEEAHDA